MIILFIVIILGFYIALEWAWHDAQKGFEKETKTGKHLSCLICKFE